MEMPDEVARVNSRARREEVWQEHLAQLLAFVREKGEFPHGSGEVARWLHAQRSAETRGLLALSLLTGPGLSA